MSNSISTASRYMQSTWQINQLLNQVNTLTNQVSSGQLADPAGQLGSQAYVLYEAVAQNGEQNTLNTSITAAGQRLDAMQTAMTSIASSLSSVVSQATVASDTPAGSNNQDLTALVAAAQGALPQVASLLNTEYAGQALFAGHDGSDVPMADTTTTGTTAQNLLSAQVSSNGGPLTAADVPALTAAIQGMTFTSTGFTANDDQKTVQIATGANTTVSYNVSADQPAFQQMMQGLTMLSMANAPSTQLSSAAQQALLKQGSTLLQQAQSALTSTQAQLGATQTQLANAASVQQSAANATQAQITLMEQNDPAADAQRLNQLQTQLQASYEVSARIAQMSFVNYMPSMPTG